MKLSFYFSFFVVLFSINTMLPIRPVYASQYIGQELYGSADNSPANKIVPGETIKLTEICFIRISFPSPLVHLYLNGGVESMAVSPSSVNRLKICDNYGLKFFDYIKLDELFYHPFKRIIDIIFCPFLQILSIDLFQEFPMICSLILDEISKIAKSPFGIAKLKKLLGIRELQNLQMCWCVVELLFTDNDTEHDTGQKNIKDIIWEVFSILLNKETYKEIKDRNEKLIEPYRGKMQFLYIDTVLLEKLASASVLQDVLKSIFESKDYDDFMSNLPYENTFKGILACLNNPLALDIIFYYLTQYSELDYDSAALKYDGYVDNLYFFVMDC